MHELKSDIKNVEKVYHLADIHIRNIKRHTEYSLVFENFYEQVKTDNLDQMIGTGIGSKESEVRIQN